MNTAKQELRNLIEEAHKQLESASCHTEADKRALADMLFRAENVLAGSRVPFTRNREFLQPTEEEEIQFACDRYTMAPTAFEPGKVYGHYGLRKALEWFREQDLSRWSRERLEGRRKEVLERCNALLSQAACGEGVGEYDQACIDRLHRQMEMLEETEEKHEEKTDLPQVLAATVDAYLNVVFSRKLRSDAEPQTLLLLSGEKQNRLRSLLQDCTVQEKSLLKKQYQIIREIADGETMQESLTAYEQIWEKHSYEELNTKYHIWGDTGKVVNMITPPGTKGVRISFRLPGEENEKAGLGHILLTGVRILCADGPEAEVPNADFRETGADGEIPFWGWEKKGNAVCRQEQDKDGNGYLYLCNPSRYDESIVTCERTIPLKQNCGYTLYFRAKQDGKFRKGLEATLEFVNTRGEVIGHFMHLYNRKSALQVGLKALSMQCHGILYALEGGREHAVQAKYDMLTFLNDFCQGAEYWMMRNERPEGCDAYGAVQAGRIMSATASTYSLIRSADVFTEEEQTLFHGMVDYLLQYCLDLRDRMSLSPEEAQRGSSNWQTDMCIGVASLMMVLPEYPNRKTWLYNAEAVLRAQLTTNLNADGSWPESIRYHHAALEHFASFAAMWEQETGEDWLVSTRLKEMFGYTIHTVTPPYVYFDGHIGTPPFGDHKLSGGAELGIYGLYLDKMAGIDRKLADEMYQVWAAAGCPTKNFSGESLALENLLYTEPSAYQAVPENELRLCSTAAYPDSGIYIFRNGAPKENYLAVMAAEKPIGHGHLDVGSFILYYHNYPIVMDSGIEGYFDASTQWHLSSYSHACLQFAANREEKDRCRVPEGAINLNAGNYSLDRGWLDVPRTCRVAETRIGEACEGITLEITHPGGSSQGIHRRTILLEKESGDVIIKDRIENYGGEVLFSLPLVMRSAAVEEQTVSARGYYPLETEVEFRSPVEEIRLEKGRTTPLFPTGGETPRLLYVRAKARAEDGVEVRIRTREKA